MKNKIKSSFPFIIVLIRYWKTFIFSPSFWKDYFLFNKLSKAANTPLPKLSKIHPITNEATPNTFFDAHYIYHPAWATRIIKNINPELHIDISSTLHFCTTLSAFIPTKFYDLRPASLNLTNLTTGHANLTNLPFDNNSVNSLSCMHTIEHVGLGRYGDKIDPKGDFKALKELQRVIKPGGNLILAVPMGKPNIYFNAHRVYSYEQITTILNEMEVIEFSLIPDNAIEKGIIINASQTEVIEQVYGCGCFWLKKLQNESKNISS